MLFYIVLITAIPNGTATTSMIGVKYFSGLLFYKKENNIIYKEENNRIIHHHTLDQAEPYLARLAVDYPLLKQFVK